MNIYRIEGKAKWCDGEPSYSETMKKLDWTPIEQYSSPQTAETRLRYWKHEFPFKDMFVWRVTEQCQQPKPQ